MALADLADAELGAGMLNAGGTTSLTGSATSAAEGIIPGSGEAATPLAETPAATPTQNAAQELINGPAGPTPTPSPADAAQYGLQPGQYVDPATGSTVTPGPGTGAAAQPGIVDRILSGADQFATKHPVAAGQAVSGVGKAALGTLSASQKRKADLEALAAKHGYDIDLAGFKQRQTQANPSVGGGPVNLNLAPGKDVLRRPDGTPVYTNDGLLNRNMNGVRG
jgi:hypothetical protein